MGERRQAHRREPIEVELSGGKVIEVRPLPWLQRGDFANEVVRQSTEVMNTSVELWMKDGDGVQIPQLDAQFSDRWTDPFELLRRSIPHEDWTTPEAGLLEEPEIVELLLAACDVNRLEKLKPLVDPNFLTPTLLGGESSLLSRMLGDGQKTTSSEDSSSQDSAEETSSS